MAVVKADNELLEYPLGLGFSQAAVRAMLQQVVEEVPALCIFHCNGQVLRCKEHLHPTPIPLNMLHALMASLASCRRKSRAQACYIF